MNPWTTQLRLAFRSLARTPGFVVLTVGSLGLAIGATVGIFSVVDTVLLDPLPFKHTERLVALSGTAPGSDMPAEFPLAAEFFVHFKEQSRLIEDLGAFNSFTNTLRVGDRVERIRMSAPTASAFTTLGADPMLGRLPVPEDEDRVMVLSHALWATWFGSDPKVIGQAHHAGGADRTIIGVMGPDFWFPNDATLLWFPTVVRAEGIVPGRFGTNMVARLAPGATPETVVSELSLLAKQLPERFGGSATYAKLISQFQPVVRPLRERLLGSVSGPLWVLLGAMGIVLLIACANVANLFMVRAERRQGEVSVRRALGAPRRSLVASQLTETGVVAGLAGLLAVALAWAGVPLLLRAAPDNLPRLGEVAIGPTTLVFTFLVCALCALLCGLAPAIRFSSPNLSRMREGGRGNTRRLHLGRNALVAGQTALAAVLLIGSALLLRSFDKLRHVDPGYETKDLFTFQFAPDEAHLQDAPSYARFHLEFLERLAALPGVERVGLVENMPLDESVRSQRFRTEEAAGDADSGTLLGFTWTAGDYFRTMGIEVFEGRTFTADDHLTNLGNVLVSRAAAELLWPGQSPLGRRLLMQGQTSWQTVVGVVEDVLQDDFRQVPEPTVYLSLLGQEPENRATISSPAYVVKTARAEEIAPEIRALVREVTPSAPMYRTYTLEGLAEGSMAQLSFTTLTLGIAAGLALILGLVGLYGVLSFAVAERTREIGLRMALGAAASRVRRMIVGQGAKVLAVGLALGITAAIFATRALGTLLFGVEPFELGTYAGVTALMALVGLAACYLPARRASRVDPMVSLRSE